MAENKETFITTAYRGDVARKINHEVNLTLDLRDFNGRPALLFLLWPLTGICLLRR